MRHQELGIDLQNLNHQVNEAYRSGNAFEMSLRGRPDFRVESFEPVEVVELGDYNSGPNVSGNFDLQWVLQELPNLFGVVEISPEDYYAYKMDELARKRLAKRFGVTTLALYKSEN